MGKKTWTPSKTLQKFIDATFGIPVKEQLQIVEAIGQAINEVAPAVRAAMDSMHDQLSDGRSFRLLNVLDDFNREDRARPGQSHALATDLQSRAFEQGAR